MTRITWPDAFYAAYDHDLYGAVTAVRENGAVSGAGVLATWAYDDLGQPETVARAGGAGASTAYGYDGFARLDSLAHNAGGTADDVTLDFDHNPSGQITGRAVSNPAYVYAPVTGSTAYDIDGLNAVTEVAGAAVTYDANRNITGVTGSTYGYDAANRLTSANAGAGAATFTFDPADRLYQSSVGAAATRFQYSGAQLTAEYDGTGALVRRHVPGLGLDGVVTSYDGAGTTNRSWLLADERGSVIALAGGAGAVTDIDRYDEYGVPASGNVGRFQYTGQAWLPEAGLYHYRARAYAPQLGRFMQTDPIGYEAGANLYAYVGGDPINRVDPLGLDWMLGVVGEECTTSTVDSQPELPPLVECRNVFGWVWIDLPSVGGDIGNTGGGNTGGGGGDPTPEEQTRACSTGIFRRYLGNAEWERQMATAMQRAQNTPSYGPGWARGSEFAFMSGQRGNNIRIGNIFTDRLATAVMPEFGWQILWIGWNDIMIAHTHQFTDATTSNSLSIGDFEWARGHNTAIMAQRHNNERYCYDPNA